MSRFFLLMSFAIRDIAKSRIILILIIVSLSTAFAAVFISSSILGGFSQMLANGAIDSLGHIVISPINNELIIENVNNVTKEISAIDNVESFSVRSYAIAGIKYKEKFINPYRAIGFNLWDESAASELPDRIVEGRFIAKPKEVVLGLTLADALVDLTYDRNRIKIGEEIEISTLNGQKDLYKVSGIMDAKTFHPNWLLIFDKKELERMDETQKNSEIIVKLKNPDKLDQTISEIKNKALPIRVASWEEEAGYITDIMEAVNFVTGSINKLLIVSVFVIISVIIFINVFQQRRQVGIIKSMGGTNVSVVIIYIFETLIYSIFSYILGFLVFMLMHLYSLSHPIHMLIGDFTTSLNMESVWSSMIILFGAAIGGSFIPAYIAGKTKVIDVLRGSI